MRSAWSSTAFSSPELTEFAEFKSVVHARNGLAAMCLLSIAMLLIEAVMYIKFDLDNSYLYACVFLVLLSLGIWLLSRSVRDPNALYLLGITLLVVSGTANVLLAHYQQAFHPMLFAAVAVLFMVVPMMPWGLREAMAVTILIYAIFTFSAGGSSFYFAEQSLWTLQFIMIGTSIISLSVVVRNVLLRKHDMKTQHDLILARDRISDLSKRDPLTGAWNRRYFDEAFARYMDQYRRNKNQVYFMLMDIDDFKIINDQCGHESGDQVLQFIGQTFNELVSGHGNLVRMGGDEFALVFADLDPKDIAARGISRLRELTSASPCSDLLKVSLSFGAASVPHNIDVSYRQLYKQADMALYQAKLQKGSSPDSTNIVVSTLHDPEDIHNSTQRLWNPMTGKGPATV
jgi:diguanylate cyclase (GGDEF)-like protein